MRKGAISLLLLLGTHSAFAATHFTDLNLSNTSAYLGYAQEIMRDDQDDRAAAVSSSIMWNTDNNKVFSVGIAGTQATHEFIPATQFSVGLKTFVAVFDGLDVTAIALGGGFRVALPVRWPFNVTSQFYYAPDVVTFRDGDNFLTYDGSLEFVLDPRGLILYSGYRIVTSKVSDNSDVIDNTFTVGIRFMFG